MYTHAFLGAGHSDVHPITKEYITAPAKQFQHTNGKEYHNKGMFYEGVKNRVYINEIARKITEYSEGKIIPVIFNHPWEDTALNNRISLANDFYNKLGKGIYFSEHSNATPQHTARGFSVWTSPGTTISDPLANKLHEMYTEEFIKDDSFSVETSKRVRTLQDVTDGDLDYEANFYVLRATVMPAILSENLFFDQPDDADVLMDIVYFEKYTTMVAKWMIWCIDYLNKKLV